VLAVGDQAFQKKCTQRISEVSREGRTILLVSHDLPMIAKLSTRMIWMQQGQVHQSGRPADVVGSYYSAASRVLEETAEIDLSNHVNRQVKSRNVLRGLRISDASGNRTTSVPSGENLDLEVTFDPSVVTYDYSLGIDICDLSGAPLGQLWTSSHSNLLLSDVPSGRVTCQVHSLPLIPGEYSLTIWVGDLEDWVDRIEHAVKLTVLPADHFGTGKLPHRRSGPMLVNGSWSQSVAEGRHLAGRSFVV